MQYKEGNIKLGFTENGPIGLYVSIIVAYVLVPNGDQAIGINHANLTMNMVSGESLIFRNTDLHHVTDALTLPQSGRRVQNPSVTLSLEDSSYYDNNAQWIVTLNCRETINCEKKFSRLWLTNSNAGKESCQRDDLSIISAPTIITTHSDYDNHRRKFSW